MTSLTLSDGTVVETSNTCASDYKRITNAADRNITEAFLKGAADMDDAELVKHLSGAIYQSANLGGRGIDVPDLEAQVSHGHFESNRRLIETGHSPGCPTSLYQRAFDKAAAGVIAPAAGECTCEKQS